jgi:hypothetical protein
VVEAMWIFSALLLPPCRTNAPTVAELAGQRVGRERERERERGERERERERGRERNP